MNIQLSSLKDRKNIAATLAEIGVHKDGIKIMSDKAVSCLIKIKHIPSWIANILKQEILSLNADAAINKDAITGRAKFTDCLIMGNLSQLNHFVEKLSRQPPSLKLIGQEIKNALENFEGGKFVVQAKDFRLKFNKRTLLMAIVNITPDSFSGDGLLGRMNLNFMERYIKELVKDGADIIDIGGESTRPGALPVSLKEELNRTIPLIKRIAGEINVPISIDTYKPEVAKRALKAGASIVNNIKGIKNDAEMLSVIKKSHAAVILMHIKGSPKTMQKNPRYDDLMGEIISTLRNSIDIALAKGIKPESIIVDPGIGFGKTLEQNVEIIKRIAELKTLGKPILVGPSRKSFIGKILNLSAQERLLGTAAAVAASIFNGANIVRVHDLRQIKQVVKITDSIIYN